MSMKKKIAILSIILIFLLIVLTGILICNKHINMKEIKNTTNTPVKNITESAKLVLPTEGNEMVVKTNSNSTIRVINEFDKTMFEGKKSILFMWGSWCENCATEMNDIKKVLDYYKDSNLNIVFISHDFDIETLIEYVERDDVNFDTEILLDLGRVIRKALDPDAGTVPVTYFLDETANVKYKYDIAISFGKVQEIIKDLKWNN